MFNCGFIEILVLFEIEEPPTELSIPIIVKVDELVATYSGESVISFNEEFKTPTALKIPLIVVLLEKFKGEIVIRFAFNRLLIDPVVRKIPLIVLQ
jgi:hypothetical protein